MSRKANWPEVALIFWLSCSKQTRKKARVMLPRGLDEDSKHFHLRQWMQQEHGYACTGNLSYGWRYAR